MQEWIIAMLVLSILLILRDMAKTVLKGRKSRKEEPFPLGGEHPQKEKVERYAASFQKLADTFYGMPYKKEYLSSAQVENVIREKLGCKSHRTKHPECILTEPVVRTAHTSEHMCF